MKYFINLLGLKVYEIINKKQKEVSVDLSYKN
jgi:hypothetical protein